MFTPERHQRILQCLALHGRATIGALAAELGVSDDTVRRDLRTLEQQGALRKTHGGALALDVPNLARSDRAGLFQPVKQQMGQRAAQLISAGQTLFIDAGSTLLEVARHLPAQPFTVITHSLDVAQCLSCRPDIRLFLTGGEWDARQRLFGGASAEAFVRQFRADWAILGACAADTRLGLMASEASDAEIKRGMLACSAQALLVADHSKFGQHAPHAVAPLSRFNALVTDFPLGPIDGVDIHLVQVDCKSQE